MSQHRPQYQEQGKFHPSTEESLTMHLHHQRNFPAQSHTILEERNYLPDQSKTEFMASRVLPNEWEKQARG